MGYMLESNTGSNLLQSKNIIAAEFTAKHVFKIDRQITMITHQEFRPFSFKYLQGVPKSFGGHPVEEAV